MAVLAGYDHLLAAAERLQWDAESIDLTSDRARWPFLDADRRRRLDTLLSGFWVAEHRVAEHLEPFVDAASTPLARDLLERQAADERRHAHFFDRVLGEVVDSGAPTAPSAIERLFAHELPRMAGELADGAVELDQAVALYHLILEAIVLSTGQDALLAEASAAGLVGIADGVARVQADERWHIGLGVHLLNESGVKWYTRLDELAAVAAHAWGPEIATPERTRHALATHRRRAALLKSDESD